MRMLLAFTALLGAGFIANSNLNAEAGEASLGPPWEKGGKFKEDLPRFQEILRDIKAFTARVKNADSEQQKIDAIVDLSSLYLNIVSDPRFGRSERLQGYRGRIANRLRDEQKRIARDIKRKESNSSDQSSDQEVSRYQPSPEKDSFLIRTASDHHWHLLSHVTGGTGPAMYFSSGHFGTTGYFSDGRLGGIIGDHGRELVNLIETILHPDFWEASGGVGVIYYYQPLRILVVRATTPVHEDLTKFLNQLRGSR